MNGTWWYFCMWQEMSSMNVLYRSKHKHGHACTRADTRAALGTSDWGAAWAEVRLNSKPFTDTRKLKRFVIEKIWEAAAVCEGNNPKMLTLLILAVNNSTLFAFSVFYPILQPLAPPTKAQSDWQMTSLWKKIGKAQKQPTNMNINPKINKRQGVDTLWCQVPHRTFKGSPIDTDQEPFTVLPFERLFPTMCVYTPRIKAFHPLPFISCWSGPLKCIPAERSVRTFDLERYVYEFCGHG